jgi:hypothetical protein
MKKTVLMTGEIMALVAGVFSAINYALISSPHYPFPSGFGMLLLLPALAFSQVLGLESPTDRTLWFLLAVVPNTVLSFGIGACAGWAIHRARQFLTKHLLPVILVLALLTCSAAFLIIRSPSSSERSIAISGTLLDERTRTPVSGADVFFTYDSNLHSTSDQNGKFAIPATQYHYWIFSSVSPPQPPLSHAITITHTNWATREIYWDHSPQTNILQRLPEPSVVRPWMTFDGNGTILQDGGAVRYLAPRKVPAPPGKIPKPIYFGSYDNGIRAAFIPNDALSVININFSKTVFNPHLTVERGPKKPSLPATTAYGLSWSFWPRYTGPADVIRTNETSYIYRLEFIR